MYALVIKTRSNSISVSENSRQTLVTSTNIAQRNRLTLHLGATGGQTFGWGRPLWLPLEPSAPKLNESQRLKVSEPCSPVNLPETLAGPALPT